MKINEMLTESALDKIVDTIKKTISPSNPVQDMRDKVQKGEVKDAGKDSVFQKMSDRNKDMKQALDTISNESKSQRMDPSKVTQAVPELHAALMANKLKIHRVKTNKKKVYDIIDGLMQSIALAHDITGQKLHDMWVKKYKEIPDTWILNK
jgi:hypothetical protein